MSKKSAAELRAIAFKAVATRKKNQKEKAAKRRLAALKAWATRRRLNK